MHSDFLHKHAQTPLHENYLAAGVACSLHTNSEHILQSARDSFLPLEQSEVDFSMRFWVDGSEEDREAWCKPYVRGLDDLIFAGFGVRSSLLVDLYSRRVIGRFSATMANDRRHWRSVIFPVLLSVIAGTVGVVELHASCVARDGQGLILMGPSRSGKSTLAMAFAGLGFQVLSDDRTFCSVKQNRLLAYGLPRPIKLRPEAAFWFDDLRDKEPTEFQNSEPVFFREPNELYRSPFALVCEPQALIYLDRCEVSRFRISVPKCDDVMSRIETDLLRENPIAVEKQRLVLGGLASLPCWHLEFGGMPHAIARQLTTHFETLSAAG